jgi:hypothetical protein
VISSDKLYAAFNIKELAKYCIVSKLLENEIYIKAIDSTGEEFWYSPEHCTVTPSFFCKRWTKMRIIETYNNSSNCKSSDRNYSTKSLSTKRLENIVLELCKII